MNENILRMARECGLHLGGPPLESGLARFASLVRADEREACAKVCDDLADISGRYAYAATAIRKRGEE